MGLKQIGRYVRKTAAKIADTFISLTSVDASLSQLLNRDYRFGTSSKDFLLSAYGANPYVFMVVDRICQRLVQIDKKLFNKKGEEIQDALFQELLESPNEKENGDALLYRASATHLVTGECFVVRKQTLGARDNYFIPVNFNVTINEDTKGRILSYWITSFGHAETFLPNEVLHIYKPDITLDTNHGFSTLRATRKVWESNNEVWASEASLHKNKGITGVIFSDGNRPMTDREQKELQAKYDRDNTGASNFGKVKVSTAKLGYQQMGMNPNDLKSIETRLEHLRTICASFNVDSKLFGDSQASTYNNMAEAQRAFIVNAVIPLSKLLLPRITSFMAASVFKEYSLTLDEDNISELQLTKEQKSARLGREVLQGILTPEQARERLYPEITPEAAIPEAAEKTQEEEGVASAQIGLKGSVGGVQGILEIQQSVVVGTTSRPSALTILVEIYGFDLDTAADILG